MYYAGYICILGSSGSNGVSTVHACDTADFVADKKCRGITRLTVTVVVIMFELTGALTYILPTMVRLLELYSTCVRSPLVQIVVLVTKAVSDQFGGGGISDHIIKFNGYPFLEKEDKEDPTDHAFIEPSESHCIYPEMQILKSCLPSRQCYEKGSYHIRSDRCALESCW